MQIIKNPIERIFLVDDDEDDCMVFKLALHEAAPGLELHCSNNCDNIIEQLDAIKPDLIFLDINLPRTNGIECLKKIQTGARLNKTPLVMYSSSELPKDLRACFDLGATLYFRKPLSITQLIDALKKILQMAWHAPETIKKQYYRDGKYHAYQ